MSHSLLRKKSVDHILAEAASGYGDGHGAAALRRVLSARDLTLMGIAAIVGAGIFSTIGTASAAGGPGIVLLFLFVSVACGFSALCYAEFASLVPVSGSAYTYSYVAFGEIFAWIIGWDLLMEYAIGNIAVAISWSDYFTSLLDGFGLHVPDWLTMDWWTAQYSVYSFFGENIRPGVLAGNGLQPAEVSDALRAWNTAPRLGGLRIICDLPAFLITVVITAVIYVGIRESKRATNAMVWLKMGIILLVLIAGAFYVRPANWHPFLPNGMTGVLAGTSAVFFSYIGFDAISTTAEECKNPQRDLPRGMIASLIICTVVYVGIALVLTGMVPYNSLGVGDPLAYVFQAVGQDRLAGIVAVSAIIATASVLLVFQLGQPRIWMSMSRDGLLPPIFARIHPRYKTPSFSTVLTGVLVGVPALFLNLKVVVDLTAVGTLFAFVLVCGGIIRMHARRRVVRLENGAAAAGGFRVPYISGRILVPLILAGIGVGLWLANGESIQAAVRTGLDRTHVPYIAFAVVALGTAVFSVWKRWSLIPVLGFLACAYLLCESGVSNWERFLIWLGIGLVIYFLYGQGHSRLGKETRKKS